ncbi:MAG: hypothetical protein JXM79_02975 [Sedimentisphaerales bacterium]|nr:hypothetical protein [Sedimentisphaerales bacterium]
MAILENTRIMRIIPLLIVVCFSSLNVHAKYGGGTGDPNDPYLIYTAEQMNTIGAEPNDWDKHFKLMNDIDLVQYPDTQFNIIGYYRDYKDKKPFRGVFDGNNYSICNFSYISQKGDSIGIFGYVSRGELRNVRLVDPNIAVGGGTCVGCLAGKVTTSIITNCHVEGGSVLGNEKVGGLVGYEFSSETIDCSSKSDVSGERKVGGLIGESTGVVDNCHAIGNVIGTLRIGGLIGENESAKVTACWSHSNVQGRSSVGGLVGNTRGSLKRCYSKSQVTGTNVCCGGLAGSNFGEVFWCYTEGIVTGMDSVGGLLAANHYGKIFSCYSSSVVTGETDVGGLISRSWGGWVQSCFWDAQASGTNVSAGGLGYSTLQMKSASTFRGWHNYGYWTINEGLDYPRLVWETRAGAPFAPDSSGSYMGSGEPNDPYQVRTPEEFVSIAYRREDWGKHFILMRDLDMSGIDSNEIMPIGDDITAFSGVFDGGGHTITNYSSALERLPYVGVFGVLVAPIPDPNGTVAVVRNLHLVNAVVHGESYVGSMVGWNRGTVTGCSVEGEVTGFSQVGGLVGYNGGWGTFPDIGIVRHCFWDMQTCSQTTSFGGMGKTTAEMQTATAFLEAGWDFVDETTNGIEDIWWILEGQDYPRLWWEAAEP